MGLTETYRPKTWSDVVGQDKIVSRIRALAKRGLSGRAFWITGQSGTGKTTIARLLAAEIADPFCTLEIDAGDLTIGELHRLERSMGMYGFGDSGKSGRAYIVNEAHGLASAVIRSLLVLLERIPRHVVWIFTTTVDGQDSLFEDEIDAHPL
ncbi:MAG: AAA family ATPase, partial [Phycisphaerales bacterium]